MTSLDSSKINGRDRIRAEKLWDEFLSVGYTTQPNQGNKLYFTKLDRIVFSSQTYFRQKFIGGQWQAVGVARRYR